MVWSVRKRVFERIFRIDEWRVTNAARASLYALSVCIDGRSCHLAMQTAIVSSAPEARVMP